MNSAQKKFKRGVGFSFIGMAAFMAILSLFVTVPAFSQAAEEGVTVAVEIGEHQAVVMKWGFLAAALAFGLGAVGAGIAISSVGSAAMGAMSEKPEVGSQALIFVAMAEGIVVFGLIAALMILGKI